ncbi:MAG: hypothetical protein M3P85_09355 [Actinomycetota bacterium]|nr:hypothetical protein [Actinomycetota bacterium]
MITGRLLTPVRRRVVVWLDGPFGVGKTVVAHALAREMPGARIVNPERVGYGRL